MMQSASSKRSPEIEWLTRTYGTLKDALFDILDYLREEYYNGYLTDIDIEVENKIGDRFREIRDELFGFISALASATADRALSCTEKRIKSDVKSLKDLEPYVICDGHYCDLEYGDFYSLGCVGSAYNTYAKPVIDSLIELYDDFYYSRKEVFDSVKVEIPSELDTEQGIMPAVEKAVKVLLKTHGPESQRLVKWVDELGDLRYKIYESIDNSISNARELFPFDLYHGLPLEKIVDIRRAISFGDICVDCMCIYVNVEKVYLVNCQHIGRAVYAYHLFKSILEDPDGFFDRVVRNWYVIVQLGAEGFFGNPESFIPALSVVEDWYYRAFGEPLIMSDRDNMLKEKWAGLLTRISRVFGIVKDKASKRELNNLGTCEQRGDIAICVLSYLDESNACIVVEAYHISSYGAFPVMKYRLIGTGFEWKDEYKIYYFEDVDTVEKAVRELEKITGVVQGE